MPAPALDLTNWLTGPEVCARLGISERTLDREVSRNLWQPRERPRAGKRPERVFHPDEVAERLPPPRTELVKVPEPVVPPVPPRMAELSELPPLNWPAILGAINSVVAARMKPEALWVKVKEASAISGLSERLLRRLVKSKRLAGIVDRAVKVRRADLATLDPSRMPAAKKRGRR